MAKDKKEKKPKVRTPRTIWIIRHAEEDEETRHLSGVGHDRANRLVDLFSGLGVESLFAAENSKHRARSVETLEPLELELDIPIRDDFQDDEYKELARRVLNGHKYTDDNILICWHRKTIPALAKALGAKDRPDEWGHDDYSSIWTLSFDEGGYTHMVIESQD